MGHQTEFDNYISSHNATKTNKLFDHDMIEQNEEAEMVQK